MCFGSRLTLYAGRRPAHASPPANYPGRLSPFVTSCLRASVLNVVPCAPRSSVPCDVACQLTRTARAPTPTQCFGASRRRCLWTRGRGNAPSQSSLHGGRGANERAESRPLPNRHTHSAQLRGDESMYRPILSLMLKPGSFRTRVSWTTLLAAVVLLSLGGAAQKSAKVWWPQFRGPNSSGLGEGRPPVHFGPDQNVLWKTAVGPGLSSPIIWEGRIFLTEFDRANKQLATLCIDRRTGQDLVAAYRCAGTDRKGPRNQ